MTEEVKKQLESVAAEMKGLLEKQSGEIKANGETATATAKAIEALDKKHADIEQQIAEMQAKANKHSFGAGQEEVKSIGQLATEGETFARIQKHEKVFLDGGSFHRKALSSSYNNAVGQNMRVPGIFTSPADRPVHIRDLMRVVPTESSAIEFVADYAGFTNSAASQWNSDISKADGGTKAESELTTELKTNSVVTIAHYLNASRQVLEDQAMLRGYIDGRLTYGVKLVEDTQILNGAGTNGTLTGIMNTTGIGNVGDRATSSVTYIDHIRSAITTARLAHFPVDGILLHPTDFATIETSKGTDGHYVLMNVVQNGVASLWRVPVVESDAMTQGTFLVGNFAMGATLYERNQAGVRVSESHDTNFIKNIVTILGEERVALTVELPGAFCKGSFDVAST